MRAREAAADAHLTARATVINAHGVDQAAPAPRFSRTPAGPVGSPPAATTPLDEIGWQSARLAGRLANLDVVAVRASREILIDAPPEVILEALADIGSLSSGSPVHKRIEVLDGYADGRPHHVKATIKIFGLVDNEILEYHWGPNWVVWDAFERLGHVPAARAARGVQPATGRGR